MRRIAIAVLCALAAAASVAYYVDDGARRDASARFVREYDVEKRRPSWAETIANAPSADVASELAADVALQDTAGTVNLSDLDDETRRLWITAVARFDDELRDARALVLQATRARPGWPYNRALLGQLEFMRARRQMTLAERPELWFVPLQSSIAQSPGEQPFSVFTAGALIEAWPYLGAATRQAATPVFRTAMTDGRFVRTYYLDLVDIVGHDAMYQLLPDHPSSLRAAIEAEASVSDIEAVAGLYPRWERAEWSLRVADLKKIDERAALNDELGLRRECSAWTRQHTITDFDTPAGRRQVARVLSHWPPEHGSWRNDPRGDIVRFFLNGRATDAEPRGMQRAVSVLTDVPDPVAARVALLAGDVYGGESLARSSETAGAFEWTRFYVDLAYHHLAAGRKDEALQSLDAISSAAREECDVLVVRRLIEDAASADDRIPDHYPASFWSRNGVPVCIDRGITTMTVRFDLSSPSVLSVGFDDGRSGTQTVQAGRATVSLPVGTRTGRHVFTVRRVAGGTMTPVDATLR